MLRAHSGELLVYVLRDVGILGLMKVGYPNSTPKNLKVGLICESDRLNMLMSEPSDGYLQQEWWLPKITPTRNPSKPTLLGGSWDLVSKVISTINGVISRYKYSYLNYNPSY